MVNILPGKGSWLGEFFDPAEPEDYWEKPHVHHVTWWYDRLRDCVVGVSCCELTAFTREIPFLQKFCWPFRPEKDVSFKRRSVSALPLSGVLQMYRQALSPLDPRQSILAQSHRGERSGGSPLDVFRDFSLSVTGNSKMKNLKTEN